MKSFVFWNVTPYSLLKVNRRLEGKRRFNLQVRKITQKRDQNKTGNKEKVVTSV
jgi:hypothetical protein